MAYALAADIHVAPFDDRAVVLDLAHDRYRMIEGKLGRALSDLRDGRMPNDEAALARLVDIGILVRSSRDGAERTLPPARWAALEEEGPAVRIPSARIFVALVRSMTELRVRGLRDTLRATERRAGEAAAEQDGTRDPTDLVRGYAETRLRVPIPPLCLRDSLALMRILAAHRIEASLVIGVRLDPFLAHCWVQQGDVLLTDTLQLIGEYRPILVL